MQLRNAIVGGNGAGEESQRLVVAAGLVRNVAQAMQGHDMLGIDRKDLAIEAFCLGELSRLGVAVAQGAQLVDPAVGPWPRCPPPAGFSGFPRRSSLFPVHCGCPVDLLKERDGST